LGVRYACLLVFRRRGGGRSTGFDLGDDRADPDRLPLAGRDLDQLALEWRRDLGVDLVGHHLDEGLIALDHVALVLEPFVDGTLGHGLPELGHLDLRDRHWHRVYPAALPSLWMVVSHR